MWNYIQVYLLWYSRWRSYVYQWLTGSPSCLMSSNWVCIYCSQSVAAIPNSITETSGCTTSNWLLAFFQHLFVFPFALMHLCNFNICSLVCLSFSNISNGSHWTGPHSLQTNKCTHTATGTYNSFIVYQSLLQHASFLLTVFKTVAMPCQTTQ